MPTSSDRSIVLVHGHGPQPDADALRHLWCAALRAGLQRDQPALTAQFDSVDVVMPYYADAYPAPRAQSYDAALDLIDRKQVLQTLASFDKPRRFRRSYYDALPGKSALPEFLADVGAPLARGVGLGKAALRKRLPESAHYWHKEAAYQEQLQRTLIDVLAPRLSSGQRVLLIAHGFGAVVAYDSLWQISHGSEPNSELARLHTWLTLGAPLADNTVRRQLSGHGEPDERRYPSNILHWHNVAAEDDAICHDETVANDFAPLLAQQRIHSIDDHLIYNLSVRFGRSDPHDSLGYLVHPKVTGLLADWLAG